MLRWKTLAAFLGVMATAGLASAAATISISGQIGASFSGNVGTSGPFTNIGPGIVGGASLYRVDIFGSVAGAAADEAFGATSFDAAASGGASLYSGNNIGGSGLTNSAKKVWSPNNPALVNISDSGGTAIPTTFTLASDAGTPADFKALTNAIDPANLGATTATDTGNPVTDPRMSLGKSTPFLLGTIWVVPGSTEGHLDLTGASYLTASATTHQLSSPAVGITVPSVLIPAVPEPASCVLAGLGVVGLLVVKLRKR